jgi:hypothetical protein
MKKVISFMVFLFIVSVGSAQIWNNHYFGKNSDSVINNLDKVAIVPGWIQLKPNRYEGSPEKLKAAEEAASLFFQNLLYSSLLSTNPSKLQDIYSTNALLTRETKDFSRVGLAYSPVEFCRLLDVDAVLLSFVSYDKSFIRNNDFFLILFEQVEWNKEVKRKDMALGLFYKDGTPLWAASFIIGGVKTTMREENQISLGNQVTLYGPVINKK